MKTIRFIAILMVLVLLGIGFGGCSKKTHTAGKMHYDLTSEPINLDPQTASDLSSLTVINQIFEPLVTVDEQGEIVCEAAQSYEVSDDGLTYEIVLRSGLQWNNGSILDAQDYAFGLQRVLLAETQSPHTSKFFGIQNAKEYHEGKAEFSQVGIHVNGLRLVITLSEPDTHFMNRLADAAAMPCNREFFEGTKGKYGLEAETVLANGAFYLQTWAHEQYLKLTKNENYRRKDAVKISGVTMWTNNVEGREETFWKGNTQGCYVSGESYAAHYDGTQQSQAISNTVYGIVFNQNTPALQNKNIRKAIAGLFSNESYRNELPAYLTVTDAVYASDCAVNAKPYRLQQEAVIPPRLDGPDAKAIFDKGLEELDEKSITGLKIVVPEDKTLPLGDYFLELSQAYQKHLDLYIGIERLDKEAYDAAIKAGEYDLAILPIVSEDLSPITMLADFTVGYFACGDAEFLSLYRKIEQNASNDVTDAMHRAEEILIGDGWFIPMYEQAQFFVCGRDTDGIAYNPYTGLVSFRDAAFISE